MSLFVPTSLFPPRGSDIVYFEVSLLQTTLKNASKFVEEKARVVIGLSGDFFQPGKRSPRPQHVVDRR